jgi:N-methylhydantoinase B
VHAKESRGFEHGDVISFQQPGAGGYGDPLDRDPWRVLEDVLDDYVSVEAARREYGVVIAGDTVDEEATGALRGEMRAKR